MGPKCHVVSRDTLFGLLRATSCSPRGAQGLIFATSIHAKDMGAVKSILVATRVLDSTGTMEKEDMRLLMDKYQSRSGPLRGSFWVVTIEPSKPRMVACGHFKVEMAQAPNCKTSRMVLYGR